MHFVTRALGTLVAAAAVTAASLPATHASSAPVTVDDRLGQITQVEDAVPVARSPISPVDAKGRVTVETAHSASIALDLPVAAQATVARIDGRYVLPADGGATLSVAPTATGTQILVGIESAEAPTSYAFGLDAPRGFVPELTAGGAVEIVNEAGDVAAQVEVPWAVDAEGRRVPTRFELRDGAITQVVDHRTGDFAYPIVADPKIFTCDFYTSVCVKFTKKETKKIAKKASGGAQAFAAFLCTRIPHPVIAAVCVGTVVAAGNSLRKMFKSAAKQGKCAELHFAMPSGLLWKWKKEKC